MERWFDEVEMNTVPGVALYLVGTKIDKPRAVSPEEGRALAEAHGAGFCEVSAKTSDHVREPFVEVVDSVVGDPALMKEADRGRDGAVRVGEAADAAGSSFYDGVGRDGGYE
ncbi:Ras-like GTP-binding protein RYL1 [Cytospora mali]|uniref:Ras-like GTP-binding protein RYL1 n=1 Tax=Cytospora mali TaxID=578113 RepID=A0A194V4D2_CYTMA|nr:Ras-like GTP-binding protein RYL1 [Valsa mali var. pyri (nom. inval.)]